MNYLKAQLLLGLVLSLGASNFCFSQVIDPASVGIRQIRATTERTSILAFEANQGKSTFGVLFSDQEPGTVGGRINLMSFDAGGKLQKTIPVLLQGTGNVQPVLSARAALAIDSNGRAYVAVAGKEGSLNLSATDLRAGTASVTPNKSIKLGAGSLEVGRMLMSKRGELILAGTVDGKGFVAAISTTGALLWVRHLDDGIQTVLDIAEVDDGWVWVGGIPDKFASYALALGRLGVGGEGRDKVFRVKQAESRFARLSVNDAKLGLVYENLVAEGGTGGGSSEVYLETFPNKNSLQGSTRTKIFDGPLSAGFGLTASNRKFVAFGVASGGVLIVNEIAAAAAIKPLIKSSVKAPDYRRYHGVDLIYGEGSYYITSLQSRADGGAQKMELIFSKINENN